MIGCCSIASPVAGVLLIKEKLHMAQTTKHRAVTEVAMIRWQNEETA
jgi:hypothetical protein